MTDLHTHILPAIDDGAQTVEESLTMLLAEAKQGVDTVALTPHFYRNKETANEFLARREAAWNLLREYVQDAQYPRLILGAEVAWAPGMADWPELKDLCYQGTRIMLVELPTTPWSDMVFHQLHKLEGQRGIMPMIAHLDRYFRTQSRRNLERLLGMGYPVQISADALLSFWDRRWALKMLQNYDALLISDCHNMTDRKPNMGIAAKKLEKKLGLEAADEIIEMTDDALDD